MSRSEEYATAIAARFHAYNEEFRGITRRAALHFVAEDWAAAQRDAVARIELYERHVTGCVVVLADQLGPERRDAALWAEIKRAYEIVVARRADSDFYRTFFNSVTRDLFGTVGVNPAVEFCTTSAARAPGTVPIRAYRVDGSLLRTAHELVADLPFAAAIADVDGAARHISAEIGRYFEPGHSGEPDSIELIEPLFYRGTQAYVVGRIIAEGAIAPLVIAFGNSAKQVHVDAVMLSRIEVDSLFGYARSYFHVDLPVVSATLTLLRSFMPRKPIDELYTVLGRAKQGKAERYFTLQRHLATSIDGFVHAPGERGLVMIVFTLPSHELVFKVIRDRFGAPKTTSRAEVMERYDFVFHHDRAGRLVDAQEFKRLSLPRARFMPELATELLREASQSCRIEGENLIVEHCYVEQRLRPLDLFIREADPAAAEAAIIDYGQALRDLAASNIFAGDLLLKNFGVTSHGRVIFFDFDELCLLTDCVFRDLPQPRSDEEEMSAEQWFYCGPHDMFPEEWEKFLGIPPRLVQVFLRHHGELLAAPWWRAQLARLLAMVPAGSDSIARPTPIYRSELALAEQCVANADGTDGLA